jgi:hypothetical protein
MDVSNVAAIEWKKNTEIKSFKILRKQKIIVLIVGY